MKARSGTIGSGKVRATQLTKDLLASVKAEQKLSTAQMSRRFGVATLGLRRWMTGGSIIGLESLMRIADGLGCRLEVSFVPDPDVIARPPIRKIVHEHNKRVKAQLVSEKPRTAAQIEDAEEEAREGRFFPCYHCGSWEHVGNECDSG